ncbi:hypothetical protein K469DRAFT_683423 [Zopfia rhizophila CBS 207.26]|uniref:Uncharacterized protein n=1 Tax=Zopfia rhizophila CBS 207.26 TaxID=1314779 RepID=A0A6A6D9N5_9PEZI|nr:hypothetical protein K469DRAFT_683423 [Zopfia rhizophila CBS 207.26]
MECGGEGRPQGRFWPPTPLHIRPKAEEYRARILPLAIIPNMPLILAHELDTLTVQNIEEWDQRAGNGAGIFLDVIDKRNLTDERLERLKSLVRERDEPSESRTVNADELNMKLRQISLRRSPSLSDTASTPVTARGEVIEKEHIEFIGREADDKYKGLKNMGGRTSCEINPNPGPCPP